MGRESSKMEKFVSFINETSEWSGRMTSWGILLMVGTTCYEVVARYLFDSPTDWAYELTTMIYGAYSLLLGAYTNKYDGHIRMDVVYNYFSEKTKAKMDFLTGLLGIAFLFLFFLITCKFAIESWRIGELSSMTTWRPAMYPFKAALSLGVLLLLMSRIVTLIHDYSVIIKK
jgi:TRAP-type mannitol/chloroaromatic compound transport system permease small subunit